MKIKTPTPLMLISLLGMCISLGFGAYLFLANYHHVSNAKFSAVLSQKSVKTEDSFREDHDRHLAVETLLFSAQVWDFVVDAAIMLSGVLAWFWGRVSSKKFFTNRPTVNYYFQAALMCVADKILRVILSIPWVVIMNVLTDFHIFIGFLPVKGTLIEIAILFIAMGIYGKTGKAFPFIVAAMIVLLVHIARMIAVYSIIRLTVPFDFGTPHGKAIMPFLEKQGFPLDRVRLVDFLMMMPNAAYGTAWPIKEVIVITGSMLRFVTPDQLLGVVGHELGHGRHYHMYKNELHVLLAGLLVATLSYYVLFKKSVYDAFGFTEPGPLAPEIPLMNEKSKAEPFAPRLILALFIMPWLFAPLFTATTHILNALGHFAEYQADRYSMGFGFAKELSDGFLRFAKFPEALVAHPVYDYLTNSHPVLTRRINKIGVYQLNE